MDLLSRRISSEPAPTVANAIGGALESEDAMVQRAALAASANNGGPECVPKVARILLKADNAAVRSLAETALSALIARLSTQRLAARRGATRQCSRGHRHRVEPLSVRGSREQDVTFLESLLSSDSPHLRRTALDALAQLGQSSALSAVSFAVSDEELEVRLAAVHALGRLSSPETAEEVLPQLLELAASEANLEVRAAAVQALGSVDGRTSAAGPPAACSSLKTWRWQLPLWRRSPGAPMPFAQVPSLTLWLIRNPRL